MRGRAERLAALLIAALLGASPGAHAVERRYVIDGLGSRVDFTVRYLGFFSPGGHFGRVAGTVMFDPEHWETLAVSIRIPVDTLESRPGFWRSELLGPRFFDGAHHPSIEFEGRRAVQTAPAAGQCFGALTLRGQSRPVVLNARLRAQASVIEIEATTRLARSAFGLGGVLPLASDEVTVVLRLRAILAQQP